MIVEALLANAAILLGMATTHRMIAMPSRMSALSMPIGAAAWP